MLFLTQTLIRSLSILSPKAAARLAIELLFRPGRPKFPQKYKKFWETGEALRLPSGCEAKKFGSGDKTLLFVHGWQSHSSRFQSLAEIAIEQNYQVIAWNGPAHGTSPGKRTNLAHFARKLVTDLEFLGPIDTLMGHSFGGAAVAYAAHLFPKVDKLILLAAPSSAFGVFERFWDFICLGDKARKYFVEFTQKEMNITLDELSSENFIDKIQAQVLVVHDKKDTLIPSSDAYQLKNLRSDIRLEVSNQHGHYKIVNSKHTEKAFSSFISHPKMGLAQ